MAVMQTSKNERDTGAGFLREVLYLGVGGYVPIFRNANRAQPESRKRKVHERTPVKNEP
jgi:hypothetical protein